MHSSARCQSPRAPRLAQPDQLHMQLSPPVVGGPQQETTSPSTAHLGVQGHVPARTHAVRCSQIRRGGGMKAWLFARGSEVKLRKMNAGAKATKARACVCLLGRQCRLWSCLTPAHDQAAVAGRLMLLRRRSCD